MTTTTPPVRLDGRSLGRAWWQLPLTMYACLVVLAYLIAAACKVPSWGGWWPLLIATWFGLGGVLKGYTFNAQIAGLLDSRAGVQYLPADHALTQRVNRLAVRIGLPPPRVGVMRGTNAYASGSNLADAVVVIGTPLVQGLTSDELDAVIAHELGHIATGDVRRMQYGEGFQRTFEGAVGFIGQNGGKIAAQMMKTRDGAQIIALCARFFEWVGRYVVGFTGQLLLMASSRNREFHADAIGAALTSPAAMVSALEKIHRVDAPPTKAEKDFSYMMFRGFGGQLSSTHPTLEQRRAAIQDGSYIRRLPVLAATWPAGTASGSVVRP